MDFGGFAVFVRALLVTLGLLTISGCGGTTGPQGGPRIETTVVEGIVKVDGIPVPSLQVTAVPVNGPGAVPMKSSALTNTEGVFSLSTYESGDGVPAGQYNLTFVWGQLNLLNGQYSGDKFNGKYADATKSEISLTVANDDEPHDLGVIELTSAPAKK
jgi:hypothetical protein